MKCQGRSRPRSYAAASPTSADLAPPLLARVTLFWRVLRVALHLLQGLLLCALVLPLVSIERQQRMGQSWSRGLLRRCGVTLQALPGASAATQVLVVANHVSWLDIFVIHASHPCRFVAKAEIRAWPAMGWLAARSGTLFIERGSRNALRQVFKALVEMLRQRQRVVFFPEGTTSLQGSLLPFHANLFEAAIDAEVVVQPYALAYRSADGAHHAAIEYVGETTFVDSLLRILAAPPITAQLTCLAPIATDGAHRRELALAAQQAVATALGAQVLTAPA